MTNFQSVKKIYILFKSLHFVFFLDTSFVIKTLRDYHCQHPTFIYFVKIIEPYWLDSRNKISENKHYVLNIGFLRTK